MLSYFEKLNKSFLFKPKLLYFIFALCFYTFHQFKGQFIFDRYGVEISKLGLYLSIPQALSFFSNIWIGAINDSTGKQKILFVSLFLISGLFFEFFFWANSSMFFWLYYTIYFSLISATLPLLDKVVIDYVNEIPGMGMRILGSQRIWLTFGYLVSNFSVEHIITIQKSNKKDYDRMRPFNWIVTSICIVLSLAYIKNRPGERLSISYLPSFKRLFKNPEYMYFIFIIILCGISRAFMTTYLGLYFTEILSFENQYNNLLLPWPLNWIVDWSYKHKQSTTILVSVPIEIFVFCKSSSIIEKIGLFWPILLSQISQLMRYICYYYLSYTNKNSFIFCCLFELLKGTNYSFIYLSSLQLADLFCPSDLRTTSQLVFNGAYIAIGTILSGFFFQFYFTSKADDIENVFLEYKSAFRANIIFILISIGFFVYKYGIHENLLLSNVNAKRKIEELEKNHMKRMEESDMN